jgi:Glutathione-dependent formaldehyde-activating enzyme
VCRDLRAPELVWAGMVTRTAECACGQLRAEADGEPIRVSVCHCLACQRRTGSAFGAQARFARDRVRVSGEAREFVRFADPGFPAPTRSVYDASRRHPWVALPDALERLG